MTATGPPLGKNSDYPRSYAPDVLYPISRSDGRGGKLEGTLPLRGVDIWNAWELTWLGPGNKPYAATAEFIVPADSPSLIESKSLKLYLNSFAMTRFEDVDAVTNTLENDLSQCTGGPVGVRVESTTQAVEPAIAVMSGLCIDSLDVDCDYRAVDPDVLRADGSNIVDEYLHTHLLRSLCPVTGQPDIGSLQVHYQGPRISAESLLRFVVSFREHSDFHETCVERIFIDIEERCRTYKLSVYARYQRRGGIDINPFRSNFEDCPENLRLWRQ